MNNSKSIILLILITTFYFKAQTSSFDELPFESKKNVIHHLNVKDLRTIVQTSKLMYVIARPELVDYIYKLPTDNNLSNILPFYKDSYIKKIKVSKIDVLLDNILLMNVSNNIIHLNFYRCNINDEKLRSLCESIIYHRNLQSLNLSQKSAKLKFIRE